MLLGELIRDTEKRFRAAKLFYGHGTSNARDEAAYLVLRALRLPFDSPLDQAAAPKAVKHVAPLVRSRIEKRIPVAYLLNEAWLDGHAFYVDRRVIIPRSHIAELIRGWRPAPKRILDLCTGSGCLAILAALAFPKARVDAVDLSKPALQVAARNVSRYKLAKRVSLIHSDLFENVSGRYDLIVTNPPYVDRRAMKALPREYRYEPGMALAGGPDGLSLVRSIVENARKHLAQDGALVCEIGDGRKALLRAFPRLRFQWPETAAGSGQVFVLRAPY
ncbi:MAG: 50S ribosomal protein L3 N(5)-glutamine methyltransferase [Clostridia bacterium]